MNIRLFPDKKQKLACENHGQPKKPPAYFAETQRSRWNSYLLTTLSKGSIKG